MKKIESVKLIDLLEGRIEDHLSMVIENFQNLDEDTLLRPREDGGWSIAQCLWHLNSYGHFYIPAIQETISKTKFNQSEKIFKSTWAGSYFTKMMEPSTGTKKIKAFKNHIPSRELDGHEVIAEFIDQQEELLNLLQKSRKVSLTKVKVPISISKWIKLRLGDVFQFLKAHDERHLQQALCVLNEIEEKSFVKN